jgi:hypothetical protein
VRSIAGTSVAALANPTSAIAARSSLRSGLLTYSLNDYNVVAARQGAVSEDLTSAGGRHGEGCERESDLCAVWPG